MGNKLTLKEARLILGVTENSSFEEIKKAYRSKAIQFHPDKTNKPNYDEFVKITEAYAIISTKFGDNGNTYRDIFNEIYNNKNHSEYLDLEQIIDIISDPQTFFKYLNKIIEKNKPKKVDNLINILEREDYTTARISFESNKDFALNNSDNIIQILQKNLCKKTSYNEKFITKLDELKYYCTELKKDYTTSIKEISTDIQSKVEEIILKETNSYNMEKDLKSFEKYIDDNLALIDKIPLDMKDIESKFANKTYENLNKSLSTYYSTYQNNILILTKISLLDEYFSKEDNPHELLKKSYDSFISSLTKYERIPKNNRDRVYKIIQKYAIEGIIEAKKLNKIIRITHRV